MATKIPGETYRGQALHLPLSEDGQITAYVWPLRILTIQEEGCGGPTIGVDVGNEEVIRFDCHDRLGHWHGGGYDRLERPRESHREFPDGVKHVEEQVNFAFKQMQQNAKSLLTEAEYGDAAEMLDPSMVDNAINAIRSHLLSQGDLRGKAIAEKLIAP